jgi:hypothetical protein
MSPTFNGTPEDQARAREDQARARDEALALLLTYRGPLIEAAREIATYIAWRTGRVTSPEVLSVLMRSQWRQVVQGVDRRFMGPVFRDKRWRRIGWEPTGSHGRPVAIWALRRK